MVQQHYRAVVAARPAREEESDSVGQFLLRQLPGLVWPGLWISLSLMLFIPVGCFLLLAWSPAVFGQGTPWFTLQSFASALQGPTLAGLRNSLAIGIVTAVVAVVVGIFLAWMTQRTNVHGRGVWGMLIWALLLAPSYLAAYGWESLLARNGVLTQLGIDASPIRSIFIGPVGITWILATKGVPFAYLAISAGLLGLGRQYEDAARVHGASRLEAIRLAIVMLGPSVWSAFAIVFAEAISDFGVASTLAADARFPIATYRLYTAIATMPIQFPVASAIGWFLVGFSALALLVQYRALNGRTFAVLGGQTRVLVVWRLSPLQQVWGVLALASFFLIALGIPALGAVSASLLQGFGGVVAANQLTLDAYRRAISSPNLLQPMLLSTRLAATTATFAVLIGLVAGRLLSRRNVGRMGRAVDFVLLAAVALPGVVLAAGYIFAYNLPILSAVGIHLYGTVFLLGMAYLASALPSTTRLLLGPIGQLQKSLVDAARVHGATEVDALVTTVVPLLARGMLWAWLLTFSATLLELPISEILYPPGQQPLSVSISKLLQNYDFQGGSAIMVLASLGMLALIGTALGLFRLLVPNGWQRARIR